jgi:hypothetical protein
MLFFLNTITSLGEEVLVSDVPFRTREDLHS